IMQIFPHSEVDMWGRVRTSCFRGAWQSLNFDKEYLFGFETLVFATSGILSMHNQLFSHYFETTYYSSYKKDALKRESRSFPGHQPERDLPQTKCVEKKMYPC
uniref:Uncharacterized protein n=1 Tax=Sinocyclocheilus grahami TaxID=75366 RepID=A0A672LK17_SINGR